MLFSFWIRLLLLHPLLLLLLLLFSSSFLSLSLRPTEAFLMSTNNDEEEEVINSYYYNEFNGYTINNKEDTVPYPLNKEQSILYDDNNRNKILLHLRGLMMKKEDPYHTSDIFRSNVLAIYQPLWNLPFVPNPSQDDYCDSSTRRNYDNTDDGSLNCRISIPTRNPSKGASVETLLDGQVSTTSNQPEDSVYFDVRYEPNRILIDLLDILPVKQIITYSWHGNTRAEQRYDIYYFRNDTDTDDTASTTMISPPPPIPPPLCDSNIPSAELIQHKWELLQRVRTLYNRTIGAQIAVGVKNKTGDALIHARHLLFDFINPYTLFSEFDVYVDEEEMAHRRG